MKKTNLILDLMKGVAVALGITIIGVAAIALFAKDTEGGYLRVASVIVKILSIVAGTVICGIKIRKRGVLVGVLTASVYWIMCIALSLIIEPVKFSLNMLTDLLFSLLTGAFAGILTVNAIK